MTTIELYTRDQEIFATSSPIVASGNKNSVKLKVSFDPEWNNYTKTAVFYKGSNPVAWEELLIDGECNIPSEVTAELGYILIGVRGITPHSKVKTSALIKYNISKGAKGNYVYEPTDDIYKKILTAYDLEKARLDNLLGSLEEGSTTSDAELIDMRVGADGTVYDSAGEAVREQFEKNNQDIISTNKDLEYMYPYALDDEVFTLGTIGLSENNDEFIYRNSDVRVCTQKGFEVPLNEGDVVTVKKPVTCFRVGYKDSETGELTITDLQYGQYTVPVTSDYIFILARIESNTDVVITDPKELSRCLFIESSNRLANYCKWLKLNKIENKLEDQTAFVFDDECFIYGSIGTTAANEYKYDTTHKNRVCTAKGLEIPLNKGDIIRIEEPLTRFNMAYKDSETSEIIWLGWQYGEYTVPVTANYVFVLSKIENDTEVTANETKEFSRALSIITDKNSRLENYQKDWKLANTHEYTVLDDEIFTLGTIGLSENNDEFIYRDSDIRVCTPKGFEVPLNEGDVITIKKPITHYRICYKDTETGKLIISDMKYGKYTIPATNNYAFVLARIENNADVVITDPKELSRCLFIESSNRLNDYFKWSKINEIAEGVTEKDELMEIVADKTHQAIDGHNLVFVHFSDTHCGTYPMTLEMTKNHMNKAVNLAEAVNADFLIHTGDIIQGDADDSLTGSYGSDDKERYKTIVDSLCGSTVPFIWCQGNNNHDCGVTTDDGYALTKQQVTSYMGRSGHGLTAKAVYNDNDELKTYFYCDMPLQNCRIIVTDSSDFGEQRLDNGWSDTQITWLRSVLSDAQEKELAVVIFSHMPPHTGLTPDCPDSAANVQSAVEDFITDGGNFIACIHGHVHLDNYYYDEETGMAFITIASSWPVEQSELSILGDKSVPEREIGTSSEYAYDVYVVNAKTKKTQIFRYGAGSDRTFTY